MVGSGLCSLGRLSGKFVSGKTRTAPTSDTHVCAKRQNRGRNVRGKKLTEPYLAMTIPGNMMHRTMLPGSYGQGTVAGAILVTQKCSEEQQHRQRGVDAFRSWEE